METFTITKAITPAKTGSAFTPIIPSSMLRFNSASKYKDDWQETFSHSRKIIAAPQPIRQTTTGGNTTSSDLTQKPTLLAISPIINNLETTQLNFTELIERYSKLLDPEWKQEQKKSLESLNQLFAKSYTVAN